VRAPVKVQQGHGARINLDDDIAAAAAIAAVRAAERLELLPVDRGAAVPAIAGAHVHLGPIGELCHGPALPVPDAARLRALRWVRLTLGDGWR
jgi:hypothetical protein